MKPFLIIALLATVGCACFAQKRDTTFLKNNGLAVSSIDSADFVRIITQPDTARKAYLVTDFYKSGKRKLEGIATNNKPLAFDGEVVSYFESGKKKTISNFQGGYLINDEHEYFPNGKLYIIKRYNYRAPSGKKDKPITTYEANRAFSIIANYDSLGNALVIDSNGYYKEYDPEFKLISEQGNVKNGKKSGEWTFVDSTYTRLQKYDENGAFVSGRSKNNKTEEIVDYTTEEIYPEFPGGQKQLVKFIAKNFNYPKMDRKNKVGGRILVQFVVNREGKVVEVKTINHISPDIDKEAVRLVESFPTWSPGIQYGRPVRAQYTLPISLSFE